MDANSISRKRIVMDKIVDGIVTFIFVLATAFGGSYSLKALHAWSQNLAFEKIHEGIGSLEKSTRAMTGGKLDY